MKVTWEQLEDMSKDFKATIVEDMGWAHFAKIKDKEIIKCETCNLTFSLFNADMRLKHRAHQLEVITNPAPSI